MTVFFVWELIFSRFKFFVMGNILKGLAELLSGGNSISEIISNTDNLTSLGASETKPLDYIYSETPNVEEDADTPIYYEAKKDDSVYGICKKYNISESDFKKWNKIDSKNTIKKGTKYIVGYKRSGGIQLVEVFVNSKIVGEVTNRSYTNDSYLCEVPLYEMIVKGRDKFYTFKVLRFGMRYQRNGLSMKEPEMIGLESAETLVAKRWYPTYLNNKPGFPAGAYVIKGVNYIHSGNTKDYHPVAVIGCIGVDGEGEWVRFCDAVKELAGSNDPYKIIKAKKLVVKIEGVKVPPMKNKRENPNYVPPKKNNR
jgi:LysM repeat protein